MLETVRGDGTCWRRFAETVRVGDGSRSSEEIAKILEVRL